MGILQAAYRTYETQAHRAGVAMAGEKEPLTPVSHMVMNAQIEITLSSDGTFQSAAPVPKAEARTIIPATVESANRVGDNTKAHPLCDQLRYLAPFGGDKCKAYVSQLKRWSESEFSHPMVRAVFAYIQSGNIVDDLSRAGILTADDAGNPGNGRIEGTEYSKCLVRWRIIPEHPSACWQNPSLFESFARFYAHQCQEAPRDLCMISGREDMVCEMHAKGIVSSNFGAKLVSANDNSGLTYRGRFTEARQAYSVGYLASQKAHNALRWLAANQGVVWGGRTFLCWNPEGKPVPSLNALGFFEEEKRDFISYQNELKKTLGGYKNHLRPEDDVVIAALDAATTGRLSATYYSELKSSDFLRHIEEWYATCCWDSLFYGVQSPSVYRIVSCAFGTQRGERLEVDDKLLREHAQQVVSCMVDCRPIPKDLVRALVIRAGTPLAHTPKVRESILAVACTLIRKSRNDDANKRNPSKNNHKEEWTLALDPSNRDRSYLFGRWLAVMEQVERSTYQRDEDRETNAIRMQAVFARRPLYASRIISERLEPYFAKLKPGLRAYFKGIIEEITDQLDMDDPALEKELKDTYLLGYYHQRSAMRRKKNTTLETEEQQDEHTQQ